MIDTLNEPREIDAAEIDRAASAANEPGWVRESRRAAFERYAAMPQPTERTPGWRRADLTGIDFSPAPMGASAFAVEAAAADLERGVVACSLSEALAMHERVVRGALERVHRAQTLGKFSALAESAWREGAFVYVPDGVELSSPIHLTSSAGSYPRLLAIVGKNARASIAETHRCGSRLSAGVTDLILEDGAHLTYAHVQECGERTVALSHQRARLARDAKLVTLNFGIGGRFARADIEVELLGPGAESDMLGLVFAERSQQFDYHTVQGHRAPSTRSDLLFKSALGGSAHAVYTGVIIIEKFAQKSDAYQANRNLILSDGARADTEPMLEIEANDVRCTHGATVGPIDEEQLFYLQSRGLDASDAARLVVEGFFAEVLQKVGDERLTGSLQEKVAPHLGRDGGA
ncbi:MAG: Fe-S cluster assembly protein SufD [Candidatus Eremiobacteraeota bacterium]|nr:Fe-S cluster assembly protein SufD [Candidatus Eremiobacteraeota bacterium]MBC5827996.1 Fe-S cluster assembly protein SufD [Candidatus Eremiobacteraeota bacterium]